MFSDTMNQLTGGNTVYRIRDLFGNWVTEQIEAPPIEMNTELPEKPGRITGVRFAEKPQLKRVVVDFGRGGLTYETDLPVKIGSKVIVPPPWFLLDRYTENGIEGTVTALESDYTGGCIQILRIVNPPLKR